MAESGRPSRRLVAQARLLREIVQSPLEGRAYLQTRLTLFTKLMFWSFVTLCVFLGSMYLRYPGLSPPRNELIFGAAVVGLAVMAFIWRGVLVRKAMSVEALYAIDMMYAIAIGVAFGGSAVLAVELRPAAYASLVYGCFTVFTRALVVPSTGMRTLATSIATFVPMTIAAIWLGVTTTQELPGPAFVGGDIVFSVVAILLATTGSSIIYELRGKVSEAMQLGQYTLERRIGEGGMGAVHRASHALLRRPTAIKLIHPDRVGAETLDRFEREVQLMSQLTHPNTVAVFDYGRNHDGVLYYAMEYLAGLDLEQLVRKHGPQPAGRVAHILHQVCGALQEAHDAGMIHRDVKPANIILCERGGVPDFAKVVDFGLVKEITRDTTASSQVILGTPAYVAPEAITDPDRIGPAVDLYALGAVGYYLLTGRRVFEGKTHVDVCIQHVTAAPIPPSQVVAHHIPPALEAIVMKCLAKNPTDRYPSATALAEALAAIPVGADWDRSHAKEFWTRFRAQQASQTETSQTPTLTITIDIAQRSPRADPLTADIIAPRLKRPG
ncbi:MAG: serine/threonine-protein kinase [Kofleriaceae bacterium]